MTKWDGDGRSRSCTVVHWTGTCNCGMTAEWEISVFHGIRRSGIGYLLFRYGLHSGRAVGHFRKDGTEISKRATPLETSASPCGTLLSNTAKFIARKVLSFGSHYEHKSEAIRCKARGRRCVHALPALCPPPHPTPPPPHGTQGLPWLL